jgi:tetratricopeptide (TPR) repeat protein
VLSKSVSEPVPAKKKRFKKWMWIPVGLVACFCSLVFLAALKDSQKKARNPRPQVEQDIDQSSPEWPPIADAQEALLRQAIKNVDEHPDDPYARLELSQVFWDIGQPEPAMENFAQAREIGGEDPAFLEDAANFAFEKEWWFEALDTVLALNALTDGKLSVENRVRLARVIYRASEHPDAPKLFEAYSGRLPGIEPVVVKVARGRYLLYNTSVEEAQQVVDKVLSEEPESRPALLLQAEILIQTGNVVEARRILADLVRVGDPLWVSLEARVILTNNDK